MRFLKTYIKKRLRSLLKGLIYEINNENDQYFRKELLNSAEFNPNTVRIDNTGTIYNNRQDKKYIVIGDNSWIKGQLMTLKHGGEIKIGSDCFIGEQSRIWSSASIQIGNRVLISHNVNIHDNISHPLNSKERHKDFLHVRKIGLQSTMNISEQSIIIEDDVWIGFNSTVLKGVRIGQGAIIGANTLIVKDVPSFAVVVGNPAKIIKYTT